MKISVITLGCPKNIVDSEILKAQLAQADVEFMAESNQADVIIINTCAFILPAREEAIESILEAVQLKQQGQVKNIFVVGCLPQRYTGELTSELPEVDGIFSEYDFKIIGRKIARRLKISETQTRSFRILETPSHYAYLKLSEGCDNRCAYCTIPTIKGKFRSKSIAVLEKEAKQLAAGGVKELILIAQDTTYFGQDVGAANALVDLIRKIATIEQLRWIRILYAHPAHVSDEFINLFVLEEKLCRYIDLPLQHISDKILKSMGRKISTLEIKELIQKFRTNAPEIAIRTTMMVGYPGETEKEFQQLKNFVAETKFERLGAFKFIAEEGSRASKMKNQLSETVKEDRLQELMELQREIMTKKNKELRGRELTVIVDGPEEKNDGWIGRTQWDSPLIDNIVHIKENCLPGEICTIKINRTQTYELWGKKLMSF